MIKERCVCWIWDNDFRKYWKIVLEAEAIYVGILKFETYEDFELRNNVLGENTGKLWNYFGNLKNELYRGYRTKELCLRKYWKNWVEAIYVGNLKIEAYKDIELRRLKNCVAEIYNVCLGIENWAF